MRVGPHNLVSVSFLALPTDSKVRRRSMRGSRYDQIASRCAGVGKWEDLRHSRGMRRVVVGSTAPNWSNCELEVSAVGHAHLCAAAYETRSLGYIVDAAAISHFIKTNKRCPYILPYSCQSDNQNLFLWFYCLQALLSSSCSVCVCGHA